MRPCWIPILATTFSAMALAFTEANDVHRRSKWRSCGIVAIASIILPWRLGDGAGWAPLLTVCLLSAAMFLAAKQFYKAELYCYCFLPLVLASLSLPLLFGRIAPQLSEVWVSEKLERALARAAPGDEKRQLILAGYKEPSAVFLLGTRTALVSGTEAAGMFMGKCQAVAVIEEREKASFLAGLPVGGSTLEPVSKVKGLNYSNGKWVNLSIFVRHDC